MTPQKQQQRYELVGRLNQKRRTREAIKASAAQLLREGVKPSIAQVADLALISRSTAYRYFPSAEALIAETLLDETVASGMEKVHAAARTTGSVADRLDAVVRADHSLVNRHEAAFRTALRAMLAPRNDAPTTIPRRPGNRLHYLGEAVEPLRAELDENQLEQLVAALALCVGIESVIVTEDVCGLSPARAASVKRWAARALLAAATSAD